MPNISKRTPQRTKELLALYKQGKSSREIGAALGVSHQTANRWLEEQGLSPPGKGGRPDAETTGAARRKAAAAAELAETAERELKAPAIVSAATGVLSPYEHAKARAQQMRNALDENFPALLAGSFSPAVWERLAKFESDYLESVAMLAPKEQYNPEEDEKAREAAQKFDRDLAGQIARAEGRVVCMHCGRPALTRST